METDRDKVFHRVASILSKQLSIDVAKIEEEALISSDLGADSLDTAEIAMMIKDDFNYDLNDQEIAKIKTVRDIIEILTGSGASQR